MGTRSITIIRNKDGKKIIEMYKQYDGYPSGLGVELDEFIKSGKMVNGIPFGATEKLFNGISCFAAQLVHHFKDGPGGIYLHAPIEEPVTKAVYGDIYGVDYVYEIDSDLNLRCWSGWTGKECHPTIEEEGEE